MSVVVSLLRAIDRADGEALVMHVGEKPYVVTAKGPAELAAKPLTIPAMTGMLDQLLPPDSRQALDELGAVEYHLPKDEAAAGVHYSIVAARGGDDIWIELRRRKELAAPEPVLSPTPEPVMERAPEAVFERTPEPTIEYIPVVEQVPEPRIEYIPVMEPAHEPVLERFGEPVVELESPIVHRLEPAPEPAAPVFEEAVPAFGEPAMQAEPEAAPFELVPTTEETPFDFAAYDQRPDEGAAAAVSDTETPVLDFTARPEPELEPAPAPGPHAHIGPRPEPPPEPEPEPQAEPEIEPAPAVVVPIARVSVRVEDAPPPRVEPPPQPQVIEPPRPAEPPRPRLEGLPHLLQVAAAHGASALYVAPQAKPSLRVDGEIRVLDEAPLSEAQLQSGLLALSGRPEAAFPLAEIETYDVPGVGRVQCLGFRDHRGVGAMFKMLPARAISAEQAGLGPAIQALCTEPEGLVLVAGARGSGKSTLVAALVDQINRTRRDHVITVESQIQFVHENRSSFVSQREAREDEPFVEAVRTALREAPDVLVIDQIASSEVAEFALHAAANGHLVVASLTAATTASALHRFAEFFGEERAQARLTMAEHLRGVITQTLLRKTGGGRAAAREVLVNLPAVSSLVADGQFDQLAAVLNGGRRVGMVPLNDALLGLVQSGALDVREAHRKSPDQEELIAMLNRAGVDTSFAERLTAS